MISASLVQLTDRIRAELAVRGPMTYAGRTTLFFGRSLKLRSLMIFRGPCGLPTLPILGCRQTPCPIPAAHLTASNVYLFPHLNRAKRASRKQITADTVSYPAENLDKRSPTGYNVIT